MAKNLGSKKTTMKGIPTKGMVKMACGGKAAKGYAAGGAAKSRRGMPMTKPVPKKK